MNAALSKRALDVFEAALDQPEETRQAWITNACADDPDLQAQVLRLVEADAKAGAVLPTNWLQGFRAFGAIPERVGAYRLTHLLGQGGMGATFAAERADGLFEHTVAVKLVRPSMLPGTARALFNTERRALAKLSHRHIAQLFDGGITEDGIPYLIMERVAGVSVDVWARERSAREIVRLLCDICAGVQFAHQHLIVHADITPANVLVTAENQAKIVDFGVARMMSEEEGEGMPAPYTPGFASPARVAGERPAPADDVFAIGALARGLLAGRKAEARADLDAVLARAEAADPAARYATADALRADLQRWLDLRAVRARQGGALYVVRKFARRHRWGVVAAVFAVVSLLGALAVTSYLYTQAEQARREADARFTEVRQLARYLLFDVYERLERTPRSLTMRRDIAREAQAYLNQLAQTPGAPVDVRRDTIEALMRIADIQAGRHHANLGDYAAARLNLETAEVLAAALPQAPVVRAARARIALRLASLAMNVDQDLERAERLLASAHAHASNVADDDLLARELGVETATLANWQGRYDDARRRARVVLEAGGTPGRETREGIFLLARAYDALAEAEYYSGDLEAAERGYRRSMEMTRVYAESHPDDMEALRNAIRARWALGTTLLARERFADALTQLEEAARMMPALLAFEPADQGAHRLHRIVLTAHAQTLASSGRLEEGLSLLRAQVAERAAWHRAAPHEAERARGYAVSLAMLADLYADNGRAQQACARYAQADALFASLDARGQLSPQDRQNAWRMIRERQSRHCRA